MSPDFTEIHQYLALFYLLLNSYINSLIEKMGGFNGSFLHIYSNFGIASFTAYDGTISGEHS